VWLTPSRLYRPVLNPVTFQSKEQLNAIFTSLCFHTRSNSLGELSFTRRYLEYNVQIDVFFFIKIVQKFLIENLSYSQIGVSNELGIRKCSYYF